MYKQFKRMSCYILAGGEENAKRDLQYEGDITRLERSFRSYAAVFESVKLVIRKEQAREHYLNYPHVCDTRSGRGAAVGVETALRDADSDAVFIGYSGMTDFPPRLLMNLIREYNGESFLGYRTDCKGEGRGQFLFGIYSRKLFEKLNDPKAESTVLEQLLEEDVRLIPVPEGIDSNRIGLR